MAIRRRGGNLYFVETEILYRSQKTPAIKMQADD
jgi:hypothetical protein